MLNPPKGIPNGQKWPKGCRSGSDLLRMAQKWNPPSDPTCASTEHLTYTYRTGTYTVPHSTTTPYPPVSPFGGIDTCLVLGQY